MKKAYDVLIQCGQCGGEIDHFVTFELPKVKEKTVRGVCHNCNPDDDQATILRVDEDKFYSGQEEVTEWYEESRFHVDVEAVTDFFEYDDNTGKFVPKRDLEIESLTVWTV